MSKLKQRGTDIKIFVTTFSHWNAELLDQYRSRYLVNIEKITFTNIPQLCEDLNIEFDDKEPQSTMNNVVKSLSDKYTNSLVILLCDEVWCYDSSDWSEMKTCHNVVWLMAINPMGFGSGSAIVNNMKIVNPTEDDVLSQQLQVKFRNCHQIR